MGTLQEHQRFKQLRESLNFTQAEFGKQLDLSSSTADIERGKVRIPGKVVMLLLKNFNINPLWLYGESTVQYLNPNEVDVMPKVITLDSEGNENIVLVNAKAAAGYGQNIGDIEYMKQLPAFNFPLPAYRNASFRGFQIMGDSMLPLVQPGDWVLARAVGGIAEVKSDKIYIVVEGDSIRLKQLRVDHQNHILKLLSLNPEYPPVYTSLSNVLEIWEYHSKISFGVEKIQGLTLEKIYEEVKEIKESISKFN